MKAPKELDKVVYYLKRYGVTDYNVIPSTGKINFICDKDIANKIIRKIDNVHIYKAVLDNRMWVTIKE